MAVDNSQQVSGAYAGYDCKSGECLIRNTSGGVIRAKSISNGQARLDDPLNATIPLGAARAIADSMPRG
ncbi:MULTISPECIES: hypothetical protein [Cyanophyceae]|uniref:hypothetical protein n=1 Tax=Cyanophyceae TaxID=3028117 RepID=UPI0016894897|nr:hypothetical protein [Trichocoleus sp. FACHB-40]MBD2005603.1 hypothetical protein [Trichocoleus sp. FACHB-40]